MNVGIAAVQNAFCFLRGPADVLSASTACRRWRALACADSVWRLKLEIEGMVEKAGVFGLATTPRPTSPAPTSDRINVGSAMAFYARIFVLKVPKSTRPRARIRLAIS